MPTCPERLVPTCAKRCRRDAEGMPNTLIAYFYAIACSHTNLNNYP
ncbi:hypothetical protein LC653_33740 [Nostoc sp. CHAB 5784]|nr:hypothetical protein [Nostoc mirabile]MCC5668682.1 hypothetical protein [Nostoc mirabile CHAB5784]